MKKTCNNKGFTLAEVLVSGTIGAIIAGILLAIIGMQGSVLSEGAALGKALRNANTAREIIGDKIRPANRVLAIGETWTHAAMALTARDVSTALAFDSNGTIFGGFRLTNDSLQKSSEGVQWSYIRCGSETIKAAAGGVFHLSTDRKQVGLGFTVSTMYKDKTYSIPLAGSTYQCRN